MAKKTPIELPPELVSAAAHLSKPQAMMFLGAWLQSKGHLSPNIEISATGIPKGADAATFLTKGTDPQFATIRIRPESLDSAVALKKLSNGMRQDQNVLAHEGVHYIDMINRGVSDHSPIWKNLAKQLGVVTEKGIK